MTGAELQGAARARPLLAGADAGRNVSLAPGRGTVRRRGAGLVLPQGDKPLAGTRGQLYDHIALSVTDLDAWVAKLRGEGVTFLEEPYKLGDTRAVMIEGPSREALELVEVR